LGAEEKDLEHWASMKKYIFKGVEVGLGSGE